MQNANKTIVASWISLISNLILTLLKIIVGALFNSEVLIADGIHNAGDVVASIATTIAMRISKQPADEDHPYGHGKAEVIASVFVSFVLLVAALYICYDSIRSFTEPVGRAHFIAFFAALVSLIAKGLLFLYTNRIGKQFNSKGLQALASDHLGDVYASLAAAAGIGLSIIGDRSNMTLLQYGDPIAGIIVAGLILRLTFTMASESMDILMEKTISRERMNEFEQVVLTFPAVKRLDRLRAREHGHYVLMDIRIAVPGHLTIKEGHDISKAIRNAYLNKYPDVEEVLIHINPWFPNESEKNR